MDATSDPLNIFRATCKEFLMLEGAPNQQAWEDQGFVDRSFWRKAGEAGLLGITAPIEFGGRGITDYRYSAALTEELVRADVSAPGFVSHNDVVASYISALGTSSQKERWLPDLCKGRKIAAIAVTEHSGGSNTAEMQTTAQPDGSNYIVTGGKAYITNGMQADLLVVAVKTPGGPQGSGISLLVIDGDAPGLSRGQLHKKLGWHASDTADLRFSECLVPKENLLGRVNLGNMHFLAAMPRERLSISIVAVTTAEAIMNVTLNHVRQRKAFGSPIGSLQYNRFDLARLHTEISISRLYANASIEKFNKGEFNTIEAAQLKLWTTEMQFKVADRCLQLFGAGGYMASSEVARKWTNSRVQTIYGGTSEVMLEIISKSLKL
ncbi:acyl-CoA dehydrogenase [Xaviernesmea oryzae]|uniref:Acyl-CoA dehydrogenase n=1 Tax=Xaviernesmea oryzae TaxID=464029 RepID=A0A1Q9AU20_9HYPH|nr:acyl-CoA dehydrogenase family protein [Xaviernesmea oryzae]OLP58916.1 acyl-CoA dehydrogenase [Xaviernesmea oryzae]SEM01980.1 Acyl-CoA dehydrogenase [Xaviernesmea oryzae]